MADFPEKRRRTACWKCKERRVRCDLVRPACSRCVRGKHQCQYGLKLLWREEAVARGICFGRQGVYGRSTSASVLRYSPALFCYQGDFHFLNTSISDFECCQDETAAGTGVRRPILSTRETLEILDDDEEVEDDQPRIDTQLIARPQKRHESPSITILLSPSHQLSHFGLVSSGKDPFELQLYDYYVNSLCPKLSNIPTENPYRVFIMPLSLTSRALYNAVLGWAAYERSYESSEGQELLDLSIKYKVRALRWLREEIESSSRADASPSVLSSILATMMTLSALEIVETCSSSWVTHLKAARTICNILWPRGLDMFDKFQRFCITWLVSHDIMSWRISAKETLFEPRDWFTVDDETEIDATIACSRGLIHRVADVSTLIADVRRGSNTPEEEESFLMRRDEIERALHCLRQGSSANDESVRSELLGIAECKRLSTLIYLYAGVDGAKPSSPTIQMLTAAIIGILSKLPPKPSMTFPLFVIGTLGVWNEDDRRMVLDKFSEMVKVRALASIVKAKEVVQAVWLDKDIGRGGSWEDLVSRRGKLLSLS